jgi:hypothetical protein
VERVFIKCLRPITNSYYHLLWCYEILNTATQCTSIFCMIPKINTNYFPVKHYQIDCYNGHELCSLYSTNKQIDVILYFFWVISRRLNFTCRCFGTLCLFHLHRQVGVRGIPHTPTCLWRWNGQSVPKHWRIKFRRRGITQKKSYNIQNTAKVLKSRNRCHSSES